MSLPDWLDPLPGAAQMRATDRWAVEQRGIDSLGLKPTMKPTASRCAARMRDEL